MTTLVKQKGLGDALYIFIFGSSLEDCAPKGVTSDGIGGRDGLPRAHEHSRPVSVMRHAAPAQLLKREINESTPCLEPGKMLTLFDKFIVKHHVRASHPITSNRRYAFGPRYRRWKNISAVSLRKGTLHEFLGDLDRQESILFNFTLTKNFF